MSVNSRLSKPGCSSSPPHGRACPPTLVSGPFRSLPAPHFDSHNRAATGRDRCRRPQLHLERRCPWHAWLTFSLGLTTPQCHGTILKRV
ncbi:hypothetical protein B0O80DRAFT_433129 [Mortierella sp. GBAus27b]|nr:hypothetical protein B0O80DRAFT_433129 [Mortierella sp. GBAus27b]